MRTIQVGNLFTFSENRLQQKLKRGDISDYSVLDIIDGACKVRKYLDKHKFLKISKTPEEKRKAQLLANQRYKEANKCKISVYNKKYRMNQERLTKEKY